MKFASTHHILTVITIFVLAMWYAPAAGAQSNRTERRLITSGNNKYKERKWVEAASLYEEALKANPQSAEARYNLGLAEVRQVSSMADTTAASATHLSKARESFAATAALAKTKPGLAAKANFNLGNIEFNAKEYQKAIDYYKQALRIDPADDKARKNLRIAQLNLKKQNQDQNQNQNQNKDQDKDKEKEKEKEQQNQDRQQPQQQQKQEQPQDKTLSQQAASQILQAVDNKEAQTRARVNKANSGEKAANNNSSRKRW